VRKWFLTVENVCTKNILFDFSNGSVQYKQKYSDAEQNVAQGGVLGGLNCEYPVKQLWKYTKR
jgi:CelD/BcsL family acetyltransferase involved in cellulose biosynthesis